MKTILPTLFLIASSHFSQAQTNVYQPYPLDNASWTVRTLDGNAGPPIIEEWHTKSWSGEVIIGGETYIEVFDDPNMVGVRQDIPNEQIFYIDDQGTEYDASFDQDVQVGDTVFLTEAFLILNMFPGGGINGSGGGGTAVIEAVDSLLVGPTYRKRISMSTNDFNVGFFEAVFICGVHVTSATTSISNAMELDCFYIDGQQLLGSEFNPYCTADVTELAQENVLVYPNPNDGLFFVEYDNSSTLLEIHLLDLRGKQLADFDTNNAESGVDISNLPSGMYLVELVFEKGRSRTTLVKQ